MSKLVPLALALLLAACSVAYVPPKKLPPILTEPTAAPTFATSTGEAAGNVDCPTASGSAAGYTLFGAPAPDFNAGHPGPKLLVRCATDLHVIVMQLDLAPAQTAASALVAADAQLPADLKPVYDRVQPSCRQLQYTSSTLAGILGKDDPNGVVNIELESSLAPGFVYDTAHVDTVVIHQQYDLNQQRPCLRG